MPLARVSEVSASWVVLCLCVGIRVLDGLVVSWFGDNSLWLKQKLLSFKNSLWFVCDIFEKGENLFPGFVHKAFFHIVKITIAY